MSETCYRIVYKGEIIEGFTLEQVKDAVSKLFALGKEKADNLFGSHRVIIKSNIAKNKANYYLKMLTQAGARVYMEKIPSTAALTNEKVLEDADKDSAQPFRAAMAKAAHEQTQAANAAISAAKPLDKKDINFRFNGTGSEYFKIWIVNLLLTIVTLGIYSAWAKVRTRRYFYGNTKVDGGSFDYRANPVAILKGRLIAVAFFMSYSITSNYAPIVGIVLMLFLFTMVPWLVVRSLSFNARMSAYRNISFGFDGTIGDAAKAFILWPLLAALTLGILSPYAFFRQQQFIVANSRYGTTGFHFSARPGLYYTMFFTVFLIAIAGAGLTAGLAAVTGPAAGILGAVFYLFIFAYINVRMINLRYNHAHLGNHNFVSKLEIGSYAMLILTNTVATVLTLGIFYPWAQVRTAQYKVSRLQLQAAGDIGDFVAAQEKEVSALGQEIGDVFDIEIAI